MQYKNFYILEMDDKVLQIINNVSVDEITHLNKGAKPLRGGIGDCLYGIYGGETNITLVCHNIANVINDELLNRKVNVQLDDGHLFSKIEGAFINRYGNNDVIIKADNVEKVV